MPREPDVLRTQSE